MAYCENKFLNTKRSISELKIITVFPFFMFCVAFLFWVKPALANKIMTSSYKSKTADECIYEKECVWFHFLSGIQQKPDQGISENINIKKWVDPVFFRRAGKSELINSELIDGYLKQVEPYFQENISGQEEYNFLLVITDNVENEITGEFKELFRNAFAGDLVEKIYHQKANSIEQKCFYFHLQDSAAGMKIINYFAFIQRDHPDIKACLKQAIYAGFGVADLSNTDLIKKSQSVGYTKLELLIIFLLYQDLFKPGMTVMQAKTTFDKLYKPTIDYLTDEGVINANK